MAGSVSREEYEHPHYGWDATISKFDRHLASFIEAVDAWQNRDREQPERFYTLASQILVQCRNLDADTSQMARLSHARRGGWKLH